MEPLLYKVTNDRMKIDCNLFGTVNRKPLKGQKSSARQPTRRISGLESCHVRNHDSWMVFTAFRLSGGS